MCANSHSPFRQHKTRDKHEIDRMTMTMSIEMPDSFSIELRSLLTGLLQRDVHKRLGCRGRGAEEIKSHPFFRGIDWRVVYLQRLTPPLIPARGEVNAADAFDIGSFDDEDTKHIKLTDADQELYRNFPVVVSERWQHEIAETIFDYINHEADKAEMKRKNKNKLGYQEEEQSDCILHGYVKRLGGTFTATWLTRYVRLYPNRLELWSDTGKQPELIFMDQIEEVCNDFVQIKNEQCIVIKLYNHSKYVLTNSDEIGLKEWHLSLKSAHRESMDMMTTMAEKATKIYGTEIPLKHMGKRRQQLQQETGGGPALSLGGLGSMATAAGGVARTAANWEQKIIQKELQASSSSRLAVGASQQRLASGEPAVGATPTTTTAPASSTPVPAPADQRVLAATSKGQQHPSGHQHPHHHHHHHHHHHQHHKSFDAQSGAAQPANMAGPAGTTATAPEAAAQGGGASPSSALSKQHRVHHHHHHHHHRHHAHQHLHEVDSAQQATGPTPLAPSGGPSNRQHLHHHHHHHHAGHHHHARSLSASDKQQLQKRNLSHRRLQQSQQQQQTRPKPLELTATALSLDSGATAAATTRPVAVQQDVAQPVSASDKIQGADPDVSRLATMSTNSNSGTTPSEAPTKGEDTSGVEEVALGTTRDQENLFLSSSSVESAAASGSVSDSSQSDSSASCSSSSQSEDEREPHLQADELATGALAAKSNLLGPTDEPPVTVGIQAAESTGEQRIKLAVSLENVSEQQEVLRDPSKRITSDNKQREQDLVAQYEKLNISARNSTSSNEHDDIKLAG